MVKGQWTKVETYLRRKFAVDNLRLKERNKKDDSVEVYLGEEFIGIVYKDEEDGDMSFHFEMSILAEDLES